MNNLSKTGKLAILGAVVVIIVALVVIYGGGAPGAPASPTSSSTSATVTDNGNAPSPTGTTSGGTTKPPAASAPSKSVGTSPAVSPITFVTPVPGDTWPIDTQNPVQWSRAAGVNGEIDLLNAATLQLVGVILNVAGPNQTEYTWNTRDLLQSETSPVKTTVTPGRYVVRIIFTGNHVPTITSQPFNIGS